MNHESCRYITQAKNSLEIQDLNLFHCISSLPPFVKGTTISLQHMSAYMFSVEKAPKRASHVTTGSTA